MNRRSLCASALSLFVVPTCALAQPEGKHGAGGGGGHGRGHGGPPGGGAPPGHGPMGGGHAARAASHAPAMSHERAPIHERTVAHHQPRASRHERAASVEPRGPTRRFAAERERGHAPQAVGPYRPGQGRPASFRRIRARPFRYPSGWRYRRWSTGAVLPAVFLTSGFIFGDYWRLGLPGPPYGYVWVRFGPDLLLVDRFTGRIVDVIYGAFYY